MKWEAQGDVLFTSYRQQNFHLDFIDKYSFLSKSIA